MVKLDDLPNFLSKISAKINQSIIGKDDIYKYVVISSGTMIQINKDILSKIPVENKGEYSRKLLNDWMSGTQTLLGLKGVIKDASLIYQNGTSTSIIKDIRTDMGFNVRWVIVPDEEVFAVAEYIRKIPVISYSKCLFLD